MPPPPPLGLGDFKIAWALLDLGPFHIQVPFVSSLSLQIDCFVVEISMTISSMNTKSGTNGILSC